MREIRGFRDFRRHGDSGLQPGFAILRPMFGGEIRENTGGARTKSGPPAFHTCSTTFRRLPQVL
jgi:hypothetical protein